MADNPEAIYQPDAPRKPGRPSNAELEARRAAAAAKDAAPVSEGVSADISLAAKPEPEESLEQAIARVRAVRKPFNGAMSQKLALEPRIGYHRHWFNDVAGRIDEALASGWAHVKNPRDGKPLKRVVGTGRNGASLDAFAMELPEVFWQEEMDARHADAQARIDAIKKKPFQAKPGQAQASDQGKFYSPTETDPISVSTH